MASSGWGPHLQNLATPTPLKNLGYAIASCISKLFEHLVLSRLGFHLESKVLSLLTRPAFVLVGQQSAKFFSYLNLSETASKIKGLQTELFGYH